jgi:hypothetical protein
MKNKNSRAKSSFFASAIICLASLVMASPALADNTVKLKVLVITYNDATNDVGYAYIKPILDEMGVPYDVLNSKTQDLTAAMLASDASGAACNAATAGCVGNYNGIILTISDLAPEFTPAEWDILHNYEKDFKVRESVLSGFPVTYWDPNPPYGVYLDYGLVFSSSGSSYTGAWSLTSTNPPANYSKEVFEYVNTANPLILTDFAFAANPRNDTTTLRDGSKPNVIPLLKSQNGEALVSIVQYVVPPQTTPVRETMISTISNADFLLHSKVLAYEFINWATQGVFVGARFVHMATHLDDLFLADELWDPASRTTNPAMTYRLNSADITNGVSKQAAFRAAHPTAGASYKLDFAFNGSGAVVDPLAATLVLNTADDLVTGVMANKANFRFINHTFTHQDMDKAPVPANAPCDYPTVTTLAAIQGEITKNRKVWGLLGLPEQSLNNGTLVSGNHSGLKDRKCTDADQTDDVAFDQGGANPLFLQAAANVGVDYLASDSSQRAQNIEQYISQYDDGSSDDRLMLPRWPTNLFFNTINWEQLVDEYNYIFHDRYVAVGQDPCTIPGAICQTRDKAGILTAESDMAVRHMLTFNKWPHYFHQTNLAKYDAAGNTLQFDWLNAVFTEYEKLFKLPVRNFPYYLIGDRTAERLNSKSAVVQAVWNRTTNQVTLSANKSVPNLIVTGVAGGDSYGGQLIREISVTTTAKTFTVNRALTQ